ncbi:aminotransferase class I/II-fold pyridoxal phosphate-dependent enzyme, partial [Pseudoneobacillus sp. C159]
MGLAINCFTEPGDKVMIMPPVYHPFRMVPEANGRQVVWNPLRELPGGRYEIDFDNLEKGCADQSCRMLILSSPHNPVGIVW